VPDETGCRVGGHSAWLHTLVEPEATADVIDPTRSCAVAEAILGLDYDGTLNHDGCLPSVRQGGHPGKAGATVNRELIDSSCARYVL
jgi:hypothetical protein